MKPSEIGASEPAGVMPKNLHYLLVGGIAVVVICTSFCSGRPAKKTEDVRNPPGADTARVDMFRQTLERQRNDIEAARRQLDSQKPVTPSGQPQIATPVHVSLPPDPVAEQLRKRAALAPFASNFVVRTDEAKENDRIDGAPSVVFRAQAKELTEVQERLTSDRPQQSGRLLGHKEAGMFRLFEGTTIKTRLANSLDGSFTGPVAVLVSENVSSHDGEAVLIPAGARLLGTAKRVEAQNQARLALSFTRLLMPNGYDVALEAAPGLDNTGKAGVKDKVDNHRLRTFGISGLIGLLGGLSLYRNQANLYAAGVANASGNAATTTLNHYLNAVPTLTIRKGYEVLVYLPDDLLLPAYDAERGSTK